MVTSTGGVTVKETPGEAELSKMNPRRCGAPARGGAKRIRPSAPSSSFAQGIARCTRYTATVGVAPPHASAHSMGNAIIFIWGPNFEMLPPPIARSAARTVAGRDRTCFCIPTFTAPFLPVDSRPITVAGSAHAILSSYR